MKKLLVTLVIATMLVSMFALVACGGGGDKTTTDGDTSNVDNSNAGNDADNNTDDTEQDIVLPKRESMDKYFSGMKVSYAKDNGAFNKYLDDEIDSIATEAMYRLYMMYGNETYANEKYLTQALAIEDNVITKDKALVSTVLSDVPLVNLDDIKTYQYVINKNDQITTLVNFSGTIMFENAIKGFNNEYLAGTVVSNNYGKYIWTMGENADSLDSWMTKYKDDVKLGIAKILLGDENSNLGYLDIIGKIDTLGFDDDFASKLTGYINNSVIGSERVQRDNTIYSMYTAEDKVSLKNWSTPNEIDKHFYKGYSIVVSAIVEQIVSNADRYPYFERNNTDIYSNSFSTKQNIKTYDEIVLMPKNGTLATKLEFKTLGLGANNELDLTIEVKNGDTVKTSTMHIGQTNLSQIHTIDLNEFASGVKFGDYVGSTESINADNPFVNNNEVRGADLNTDNYIKITIKSKINNGKYGIEFKGYYDKVA